MNKFIVNGIQYYYDYSDNTGVLTVYDINHNRVADGQICDQTESFYYDYYNDIEGNLEQGGSNPDMYYYYIDDNTYIEYIASWLASTHPEN